MSKLPITILLRRKAVRLYPDGVSIGIYYSEDMNQYIALTSQPGNQNQNNIGECLMEGLEKYEIYHKSFTSAMIEVQRFIKMKGYEFDEDEWFQEVSTGPRKPSNGKTNSYHLSLTKNNKPVRKKIHFQVYGMKNSYELTMYIS